MRTDDEKRLRKNDRERIRRKRAKAARAEEARLDIEFENRWWTKVRRLFGWKGDRHG